MESVRAEKANFVLLLVEDDPVARDLLGKAISYKWPELTLLTAENGRAGLETYVLYRPHLVLTDIQMPVMDGFTMAAEIKGVHPDAVIVVISANCVTQTCRAAADALGIREYITKPVDYKVLFATIERCLKDIGQLVDLPVPPPPPAPLETSAPTLIDVSSAAVSAQVLQDYTDTGGT